MRWEHAHCPPSSLPRKIRQYHHVSRKEIVHLYNATMVIAIMKEWLGWLRVYSLTRTNEFLRRPLESSRSSDGSVRPQTHETHPPNDVKYDLAICLVFGLTVSVSWTLYFTTRKPQNKQKNEWIACFHCWTNRYERDISSSKTKTKKGKNRKIWFHGLRLWPSLGNQALPLTS